MFPLSIHEANGLPARSPLATDVAITEADPNSASTVPLPVLHIFAGRTQAIEGLPSYNPTCLKWQTYLRLAKVPFTTVASNNHASPSGSLPFLLPGRRSADELPTPISTAAQFRQYASDHGGFFVGGPDDDARYQMYHALVDTSIRNAFVSGGMAASNGQGETDGAIS